MASPLFLISDEAINRIFSHLASPPLQDEALIFSPSSPALSNNPDSAAAALGQTCWRLHILYHRAVRLVNSFFLPCFCGAEPSLQAYRFAQATVLDEKLAPLSACAGYRSLSLLRVLCIRAFPSESYANMLAEAVPNLHELVIGSRQWLQYKPFLYHTASASYCEPHPRIRALQKGMVCFLEQLPKSLRRLSVLGLYDETSLLALWNAVSRLEMLEDLNAVFSYTKSCDTTDKIASIMKAVLPNCRRLLRLSIRSSNIEFNDICHALPLCLGRLLLHPDDTPATKVVHTGRIALYGGLHCRGLQSLQICGSSTFANHWALLLPVSLQLQRIHIHRCPIGFNWNESDVMPNFHKLKKLSISDTSSISSTSLRETIFSRLLASACVLRNLSVTIGEGGFSLTEEAMATAFTGASCGSILKRLKLDLESRFKSPRQFENVACAIGKTFSGLEELDLKNTVVSPECLKTIGRKCAFLSHLRLGVTSRSRGKQNSARHPLRKRLADRGLAAHVDHMASEIGTYFPRLTILDVSHTDISSEGLCRIGRGCTLLKHLSLVRCRQIDDNAAFVFSDLFPDLSMVDLCGTSVSSQGLKLLEIRYSTRTERSGLEVRYAKTTERYVLEAQVRSTVTGKMLASRLNEQFGRLKLISCFNAPN